LHPFPPANTRRVLQILIAVFSIVIIAKLLLAINLDLFNDEAFYWKSSSHLSWSGFSNLPVMTAFLVSLGTDLVGHNPLGVRLIFLLLSLTLPLTVYLLSRPLSGRQDALFAGLLDEIVRLAVRPDSPGSAHGNPYESSHGSQAYVSRAGGSLPERRAASVRAISAHRASTPCSVGW